jgi:hypothetical protein
MHHWVAAATSALLIFGLAPATPVTATQFTFDTGEPNDRVEAALRVSNNLFAGSFTVARNLLPWVEPVAALLSMSKPNDVEISDIQFPLRLADEFDSWLGNDWR